MLIQTIKVTLILMIQTIEVTLILLIPRYIMQRKKDQENVLGCAGVFLGAIVPWWSRGHILVKIFTTMVVFVRKFPWSRRNQPWSKKIEYPPLRMVIHGRVVKCSQWVTPMLSLCLTLCPKGLPWCPCV